MQSNFFPAGATRPEKDLQSNGLIGLLAINYKFHPALAYQVRSSSVLNPTSMYPIG